MEAVSQGKKATFESVRLREDIAPIERENGEPQEDDESEPLWIDFDAGPPLEDDGTKHDGPNTYLISPISERDLFSDKNINCTAVLAIGRGKITGKEIAVISHQNPEYFVDGEPEKTERFTTDLKARLNDLKQQSEEATVEVILLGGNYDPKDPGSEKSVQYRKSIDLLAKVVQETLGFDPNVLTGPNLRPGGTDIHVATQARKIFIERAEQPPASEEAYPARMLAEEASKWSEV